MKNINDSKPRMISESNGFRQYEPELVRGLRGPVLLQLCEEFIPESGRWEPFYATIGGRENQF